MADVTDICTTIALYIESIVYPSGVLQPTAAGLPSTVTIMTGWPTMADLDTRLRNGVSLVNVYPKNFEVTHIFLPYAEVLISQSAPTITVTQSGNTITLSGTVTAGQFIVIVANKVWNAYGFTSSDTIATIITSIAAVLTANGFTVSYTPTTITVTGVSSLSAGIGVDGNLLFETKSQIREFLIIISASNPQDRDSLTRFIDANLSNTYRLENSDGSYCVLAYKASPIEDDFQKQDLYQRQLWYDVTFATTLPLVEAPIMATKMNFVTTMT